MTRPTYPSAFGDHPHIAALERKAAEATTCDVYIVPQPEVWPRDVSLPDGTVIGRETIQCWQDGVPFAEDLMAKALAAVLREMARGGV